MFITVRWLPDRANKRALGADVDSVNARPYCKCN
jgi:hypothetical protein